jgi:hypothetical protein
VKAFRGAEKERGARIPRGCPGWLFPLRGGPYDGVEVRLPWSLSREIEDAYAELPDTVRLGGVTYDRTPALLANGERRQAFGEPNSRRWPAYEYVYREVAA